jgi:hypothetical protein
MGKGQSSGAGAAVPTPAGRAIVSKLDIHQQGVEAWTPTEGVDVGHTEQSYSPGRNSGPEFSRPTARNPGHPPEQESLDTRGIRGSPRQLWTPIKSAGAPLRLF